MTHLLVGDNSVEGNHLFGIPGTYESATIVVIPVPWEVTVSYREGTSKGPGGILKASFQVDLFDEELAGAITEGPFMLNENADIIGNGEKLRKVAREYMNGMAIGSNSGSNEKTTEKINKGCEEMIRWVRNQSREIVMDGKIPVVVGGDHSTALGNIQALAEHWSFGILHIDAHADLRKEYQGLRYSHASIMYHVLNIDNILNIVQVGVRDYCHEEYKQANKSSAKVEMFTDHWIKGKMFSGESWDEISASIINSLPQRIYISFDIDGLDPSLCPNTGTPVPGGLDWGMAIYLLRKLSRSGKRIIGFDLCEVATSTEQFDNWDTIVGARLLYQLCLVTRMSR